MLGTNSAPSAALPVRPVSTSIAPRYKRSCSTRCRRLVLTAARCSGRRFDCDFAMRRTHRGRCSCRSGRYFLGDSWRARWRRSPRLCRLHPLAGDTTRQRSARESLGVARPRRRITGSAFGLVARATLLVPDQECASRDQQTKAEAVALCPDWGRSCPGDASKGLLNLRFCRTTLWTDRPCDGGAAARVTLLGDAAHASTPNLGQGACQALEDAVALAHCLSEAGPIEAALRTYERLRIPRSTAIVRQS